MPSSTAARRLTAGFGLCAAVFLGVAVAPWAIDPREFLAPGWRGNEIAGEVAPALPPLPQTPPLDRLAAIVEQPLFSSTRRPAAAPPPPASTEGLVLGAYRLTGVVVTPTHRLVLLKRADGRRTIRVAEGEAVEGWTVVQVTPDKLVLESAAGQKEFIVREKAGPKRSSP
jgi:hypothetical protein